MRNRFTTRNQWFTEAIEMIHTSGLTLIISTIRFYKTFTAEFGFKKSLRKEGEIY
ncbi:MAG: hypothetical protein KBF75_07375 [Saprospiraceae bacterium]|jgi:hypothetical protein|nr:hypothetical protein [Saprospiraceae bacterium]MCA0334516.1 hypothetical protein [Bacteroidota bacterium]MCO5278598.1 hypothetical protein [Saprospiraceae bacterium]